MQTIVKFEKIICYLHHIMRMRTLIVVKFLWCIALVYAFFSCETPSYQNNKIVKIALRDAGDKLLLSNGDSTSVVKPIIVIDYNTYQLTFEKPLIIQPDTLVKVIKTSFKKANLSEHYITEVLECNENQVAYSYEIKLDVEQSLVPCSGRELQRACYTIQVYFNASIVEIPKYIYLLIPVLMLIFGFLFYTKNKKIADIQESNFKSVGGFKFYPEQNKLMKEAVEITLSKKECELLAIFVTKPNEIIKREELTKRVWEDNGVIVGRSLDTYISKLRKKLQEDNSIKLTNVHGVGYKLEVE